MRKVWLVAGALWLGVVGSVSSVSAATCNPNGICNACTNCSACRNCAKAGGSCSVCRRPGSNAPASQRDSSRETSSRQTSSQRTSSTSTGGGWQRKVTQRSSPPTRSNSTTSGHNSVSRNQRQSARNVTVPARWSGKVVGVMDGDTITVMYDKTPVRIRLNGIDAPESRQAFGSVARQKLSSMVFNENVTVINGGKDHYVRVLGKIIFGNTDVNASLVAGGYAWWYRKYAKNRSDLARYENEARKARRGLWSDAKAVAPWEFRKR